MEITYINQYWFETYLENPSGTIEEVLNFFTNKLKAYLNFSKDFSQNTGIYLATSNSGVKPSIDFWKSALEKGPGFVFPFSFPWTLANYPSGHIARALKVKGPNYTIVGNAEALLACLDHAFFDLRTKEVKNALIFTIDFELHKENISQFGGILLNNNRSRISIRKRTNTDTALNINNMKPSEMFQILVSTVKESKNLTFGNVNEGYYDIIFCSSERVPQK